MPICVSAQELTQESVQEKDVVENIDGALRGFVWGLPPTVILENEKATFVGEDDGRLFYLDYIQDMRSTIGYDFIDDALWRARIFIEQKYYDPQERIRDLMKIRKDLVKRFGEPVDEAMVWYNNKEKNWPESWGWAVLRGEMMITIIFRDKETEVVAFLGTRQRLNPNLDDPEMNITYTSLKYKNQLKGAAEEDFLKLP